jgi:hypothetical protein
MQNFMRTAFAIPVATLSLGDIAGRATSRDANFLGPIDRRESGSAGLTERREIMRGRMTETPSPP